MTTGAMRRIGAVHDASSRGLFWAAGAALTLVAGLYLFEVGSRYLFDAPTTWSGEVVQYCLSGIVFLALPDVSRRNGHIAIDIVPAALPERWKTILERVNGAIAAASCATAGTIASIEAHKQFARGLLTNAAHPIPRYWITSIIAVGLISAALHFARQALAPHTVAPRGKP